MQVAADDGNLAEKGGEGEGFVLRGVVQLGRKVWLSLAHAVEKPSMESDGILGKEGAGMLGVEIEVETDEFAGWVPRGEGESHRSN